ncbi:hypothetical protein PR202_gb01939 [Eleusine coracana subsp. coracana]|uniref:Btz domain-containing protein n=1 Tax=Eleusine coracana subsp. coracana TaxID=191504 RepID=A0AAV5DXL0_ELECO|nr:hypothetical protein QOZ80_5BG0413260 [Eleusine coracana subsp. coracana]GJN15053.1 hypothetical protein PR202_gb01939 [Eleusine coracana subsp. coracana]
MADEGKPEVAEEAEEEEYESDLDDVPLPALRRAAASDDDEEDDEGTALGRRRAGSDADSDGQGAAEVYDEGAYDNGEEYEEYEEFEGRCGGERGAATEVLTAAGQEEGKAGDGDAAEADEAAAGEEEEKKGNEPFAVPTTGAFYMHDDRFQEARGRGRGRGRQRRLLTDRKLWNPKEEQEWVHDRFDELNLHDFHGDNTKRKQGGRFRGRGGRTRGTSHGSFRGNRSQAYYQDGSKNYRYVPKEPHAYHDNTKSAQRASYHDNTKNAQRALTDNRKNRVPKLSYAHYDNVNNYDTVPKDSHTSYSDVKSQKNAPRAVRGRVTKRYLPRRKGDTEISSAQNNESQYEDTPSNANLGKHKPQTSNSRPEQVVPVKQTVASNLNSASPPFYPSSTSRPLSPSIGNLLRGKAFAPSVGHIEAAAKGMNTPALNSSISSPNGPFAVATNQVARGFVRPSQLIVQPIPVQSSVQSVPRMPAQMFGSRFGGSNKMPSSVQPASTILSEDTDISSPGGSNKPDTRLSMKGQSSDQGEEQASFVYSGSQILGATGAMGLTGEQGFHGTSALLPVMQFGSQHPGGPGVPSIGMALPGFVSQQQLGLSNSEMTWLPMLTGASGALGGPYGSPYIAVDGSYYSGPSQQASSSVSLREPSASNASSLMKSKKLTEVVSDEVSQRQNKPRRYSEMNFGQ